MAKKKKDAAPETQNGTVASQGDKGPYIPALSMEDQSKKYDVNTTAEKVRKRDWLIRIIALILLILLLIIGIGYCSITILNKAGRFTVSLVPNEYGIQLSETEDFDKPTLHLSAAPVEDMNNITKDWILNKNGELGEGDPVYESFTALDKVWGEHNGKNYLAYTFGVRNASADAQDVVSYRATLNLEYEYKGADEAVRVMVYRNGEPTVYAKPRTSDGKLERFAADKNFLEDDIVFEDIRSDFKVGETDRYTVVIWLEGEDPECVNAIMGGEAKFSMNFEVIGGGKTQVG
ncbi:MAG: hypothetical protein IJT41_13370 [Clostridia bacterium]|nr:hypothetical protein [Clostridia bacterium]